MTVSGASMDQRAMLYEARDERGQEICVLRGPLFNQRPKEIVAEQATNQCHANKRE